MLAQRRSVGAEPPLRSAGSRRLFRVLLATPQAAGTRRNGGRVAGIVSALASSGHTAAVRSARFSPDGNRVLTASADGTARIWEVASGTCLRVLSGHAEALHSAEWSPDGAQIVTICSDGTIGLWHANDPDRLPRFITNAEEVASCCLTGKLALRRFW